MKKDFKTIIHSDKIIIKQCPDCNIEIKPEWESAYKFDWCPNCGCNINECKALGELE